VRLCSLGRVTTGIWLVLLLLVAAAVVVSIVAGRIRPVAQQNLSNGEESLPVLSPLVREVIEWLPDPLMLVDTTGRVLFANRAMREVIGVGMERKHVLVAFAHTRGPGGAVTYLGDRRSLRVEFTFRVPVERHYQAYTARIGTNPHK